MYPLHAEADGEFDLSVLPVSVQTIVGLVSTGHSAAAICEAYPFLSTQDVAECYEYAEMLAGTLGAGES